MANEYHNHPAFSRLRLPLLRSIRSVANEDVQSMNRDNPLLQQIRKIVEEDGSANAVTLSSNFAITVAEAQAIMDYYNAKKALIPLAQAAVAAIPEGR